MTEKYHPLKSPYHPLKHLAALRHGFSDEIPAEVIHSITPNNRFKVRGGWWCGVISNLENAVTRELIVNEELKASIGQFIQGVQGMEFGDDTPASLRTAAEIAWANEFIDQVLAATGYSDVELDLESLKK